MLLPLRLVLADPSVCSFGTAVALENKPSTLPVIVEFVTCQFAAAQFISAMNENYQNYRFHVGMGNQEGDYCTYL